MGLGSFPAFFDPEVFHRTQSVLIYVQSSSDSRDAESVGVLNAGSVFPLMEL